MVPRNDLHSLPAGERQGTDMGPGTGPQAHERSDRMIEANPQIGSSFESFLDEEGMPEECTAAAVKRVLAWQIERAMQERGLTKFAMANAMRASRPALDRLLDPCSPSVTPVRCGYQRFMRQAIEQAVALRRRRHGKVCGRPMRLGYAGCHYGKKANLC